MDLPFDEGEKNMPASGTKYYTWNGNSTKKAITERVVNLKEEIKY